MQQDVSKILETISGMADFIEGNLYHIKNTIEKPKNEIIKAIIQEDNNMIS